MGKFLGLVQYVSKLTPNLAGMSEPLQILTKNDVVWHWDTPPMENFQKLKDVLTCSTVLRIYDLKKDIVTIYDDASCKGLGAVLFQNGQPIAYA